MLIELRWFNWFVCWRV